MYVQQPTFSSCTFWKKYLQKHPLVSDNEARDLIQRDVKTMHLAFRGLLTSRHYLVLNLMLAYTLSHGVKKSPFTASENNSFHDGSTCLLPEGQDDFTDAVHIF